MSEGNHCFLSKTKPVVASCFIACSPQSMDRIWFSGFTAITCLF